MQDHSALHKRLAASTCIRRARNSPGPAHAHHWLVFFPVSCPACSASLLRAVAQLWHAVIGQRQPLRLHAVFQNMPDEMNQDQYVVRLIPV